MRIIKTSDGVPQDTLGQLAWYNSYDTLTLFEIHEGLHAEMRPDHERTYAFEMDLHSALIQMAFAGIPVDGRKREEMVRRTQSEKSRIEKYIHRLCEAIGYYDYYRDIARQRFAAAADTDVGSLPWSWSTWTSEPLATRRQWKAAAGEPATKSFQKWLKELDEPFNPNSNTQKLRLLYHMLGIDTNEECAQRFPDFPPPWGRTKGLKEYRTRSTNGEYTPGVDRDTLEKLLARASDDPGEAAYWAQPFLNLFLYHADLAKTLQFLSCKLDQGVFYSSFGCVTETGRLSSKKSNYNARGWNAQNVSPALRVIFKSPPGHKLAAIDYGQIESRMVAARCFVQFGMTNYWEAVHGGDLHSLAASFVWPDLPWPEDFNLDYLHKHGPFPADMLKAAKKLASAPFYRGKSRRDVSKTLGHGTSYLGKPPQMSKHSHIEVSLIEHYQDVFFEVFPEIRMWHQWVTEQVQVHGEITTLLGRSRRFFGRASDDATIREAVAFEPQSLGADYTNTALLALHKAALRGLPIELRVQKHDEIIFTFAEADEAEVIPAVVQIMEWLVELRGPDGSARTLVIPTEPETGWNLGFGGDKNPDGLMFWKKERKPRAEDAVLAWAAGMGRACGVQGYTGPTGPG
jgi:hypothetical protein